MNWKLNKYIFLSLLLFTTNLYAQWSKDPAVNSIIGFGRPLMAVSDGLGGAFIFNDPASDVIGTPHGIFSIDKFGFVRFPFLTLNDSRINFGLLSMNRMISDGRNGVYVAYDKITDLSAVVMQKIDSSGVQLWGPDGLTIADATRANIEFRSIASDSENGSILFWIERAGSNDFWDLKTQRVDPGKNTLWGENGIFIANWVTNKAVYAELVKNEVFFSYTGIQDTITNDEVRYIQKINSNGELVWADPVEVNIEGELLNDGFGGIVTAGVLVDSTGIDYSVIAQRIDNNGFKVWGDNGITVSENATALSQSVSIHTDSNGNYIFVWISDHSGIKNIYTQKISSSGEKQWYINDILIGDPNRVKSIDMKLGVVSDGNLNTIIIWRSFSDVDSLGGNTEIYGQMIDQAGKTQWGDIETLISDQGIFGVPWIDPVIVSDSNGGAIAFWYNSSFNQLYAQNINSQGILGEVIQVSVKDDDPSTIPQNFRLFQNYPNPFNPVTEIKYQLPEDSYVSIVIFNIAGQEVARLVDERKFAGYYSVQWNASKISSGIYFYRYQAGDFSDIKRMVVIK